MNNKIILTDEIIADALDHGIPIKDQIELHYASSIIDLRNHDDRLKSLNGLELCLYSANLSKKSRIKDFYSSSTNEALFPVVIDSRMSDLVSKNSLLSSLISSSQNVDGCIVKAIALDWNSVENQKSLLKRDVAEGADLPLVKIAIGKHAINLHKRGAAVEATYEAIRNTTLDLFMQTIDAIAAFSAHQQIADAAKVLISGDGNSNAAKISSTAASSLTNDDIVSFALDFYDDNNGLVLNTILAGKSMYRQLYKLAFPSDSAMGYRIGASFTFPQNAAQDITVIYDNSVSDDAGKPRLIGLNRESALVRYVETGSMINEFAKNIRNQTNLGTVSETIGFAKLVTSASRVLKIL